MLDTGFWKKIIVIWNQVIWYRVSRNQNPASPELFPEQPEYQRKHHTDYRHRCDWNVKFEIWFIDDVDHTFINGSLRGSIGNWNFDIIPANFNSSL